MSSILSLADLSASKLSSGELIQQAAWLYYLKKGDEGKKMIERVTAFRVGYELWQRVSKEREIEALRTATILAIAEFIKKNPRASESAMAAELEKQINIFAERLKML